MKFYMLSSAKRPLFILSVEPSSFVSRMLKPLILAAMVVLCSLQTLSCMAAVAFAPSSLSWNTVQIGQTSAAKSFTLTNNQSVPLTISSISVPSGSDFIEYMTTCPLFPATLAAAASCIVSIQFRPLASGSRTNLVTILDDAPGSSQSVPLTGLGTVGAILFSPTSVNFTNVAVGSISAPQLVTLKNTLSSAVTLTSIKVGTRFAQTNNCPVSPSTLAAGGTCTFSVTYSPIAAATSTGLVVVAFNTGATASSLQLYLFGSTLLKYVALIPNSINFGSVQVGVASATQSLTLSNSYSQAVAISSIATSLKDYAISSSCPVSPSTLAVNATCGITVRFTPTATGVRSDALNVFHSAPGSPASASLSGTGTSAQTGVSFSPTSLSWGTVLIGQTSATKTVSLTNSTSAALKIASVGVGSDYKITSMSCPLSPLTVTVGASCTISVAFHPLAQGLRSDMITVTDSDASSPQLVALSGSGVIGPILFSPTSLTFPSTAAASTSLKQTATMTNQLPTSLTVTGVRASGNFSQTNDCPATLLRNASCTITAWFAPSSAGAKTGTVTANYSSGSLNLYLWGTATVATIPAGSAAVNPSSLSWLSVPVGNTGALKTTILTNNGSASITLNSMVIAGTNSSDFTIASRTCGASLGAGASCAITVAYKPTAIGTRGAFLTIVDGAFNSPQIVPVSGTAGPSIARDAAITVDFGSRSGTQIVIPYGMLGAQYLAGDPYWGILADAASQSLVVQAGFTSTRLHANVPNVYATTTPDWSKIDGTIKSLQALGVHPIIEIDFTPPWLQPSPLKCPSNPPTSVPTDLNKWGQMAASFVSHFDSTFPGVVLDYEIWNEPNGPSLCSTNKLSDYLAIYAAAAPLMKQANAACATCAPVRVGGPASAGIAMPSLLTDPRTAPYVDFYSYHIYLAGKTEIQQGMTWDGAGGTPSLLSMILNPSSGEQARYLQVLSLVKAGNTPLGAKTPIYLDEYNDDWAFLADCCRNSPTYSPLFNSLAVAQILNSAYVGASQLPARMVYYAAASNPYLFCLVGVTNAAMDCSPSASGATASPYPQLYTYQLISAPGYLDLVDGGHMASSITLSSAAQAQGLVVTAFYTNTTDSILIINPTAMSFAGVTVQASNHGFTSPQSTLFTLNSTNGNITSWPVSLVYVTNGSQTTFDIPPYTVLAVALKAK